MAVRSDLRADGMWGVGAGKNGRRRSAQTCEASGRAPGDVNLSFI